MPLEKDWFTGTHRWFAPDGSFVDLAKEMEPNQQVQLELLRRWYDSRIFPFKQQFIIAEYEIVTGDSFPRETGESK